MVASDKINLYTLSEGHYYCMCDFMLVVCVSSKAGFRISCVATRSQCKRTTNARIEPSSILAFGRTFTLTSGRNARYSEPGLTHGLWLTHT